MASQWNEEFLSHFTSVTPEGRTLRSDDGRLIFMRSTDEEFVQMNEQPTEMQQLDLLIMSNDLVTKASDVVCDAEAQHIRHSSSHDGFDGTELSLVTSATSLSMHPDQTHLEHLLSQHTPQNTHQHSAILSVEEDHQHPGLSQQHLDHRHHHHLEQQEDGQSPTSLLLHQTITFDSSGSHALSEQGMCSDPSPSLHLPSQQCQPLNSTNATQVSQTQLPCQDSHPIPSFHLNEDILGNSSLSSKLASLVSEQNSRTDECSSSFSSPTTTLSFLPSNPALPIIMRNMDVITSASSPASQSSSNTEMANMGTFDLSHGKVKKRRTVDRTCGDMVWLNSKSLSSRQRDRQATQVLIEIVSHPKWQERLNNNTTKKKTAWREIGEEFMSRGYFLENPGKKCFQKWRNLERSFRDYELSKKMSSSVNKSLPDFYQELRPILSGKLSSSGLLNDKGGNKEGVSERLMEKYIDFDCSPSYKGDTIASLSMPALTQNMNSSDHLQDLGNKTNSPGKSDDSAFVKQNLSKQRKKGNPSGKHLTKPDGNHELITHIAEGLKAQGKELAQMNSDLQSIKVLLEEQKKEREKSDAESKSRFLELKAMIERDQKEKTAFLYEFLKSIQQTQNQNGYEKT